MLNWGFVRERGVDRTSTIASTLASLSKAPNSAIVRVEWPMVNTVTLCVWGCRRLMGGSRLPNRYRLGHHSAMEHHATGAQVVRTRSAAPVWTCLAALLCTASAAHGAGSPRPSERPASQPAPADGGSYIHWLQKAPALAQARLLG